MTAPHIGFVSYIHPLYIHPSTLQKRNAAIAELREAGCDVLAPDIVQDKQSVSQIIAELNAGEIDLLLFFFCTWIDEEIPFTIAQELKTIPLLLWALPYMDLTVPLLSPMTGITATGSNLRRVGRSFLHRIGEVTPKRVSEIAGIAQNASVLTKLRSSRFGIFGQNCPGMSDTICDESLLQKYLGITTIRSGLEEVTRARDTCSEQEAVQMARQLQHRAVHNEVGFDTLVYQCRTLEGMRSLVKHNRLDGLSVRCWPELRDHQNNSMCLTMSELADSGIITSCEADLTALITSYILTGMAGQPSCTLEITAYLEEQNALQFAHCGSAASSLARSSQSAVIRSHMRTGTGAVIEFPFKPKPVTIAKLLRPSESGLKIFVARGEVIPTETPVRGTVATVRVEPSPEQFVESMLHYRVEHHLVLAYGDWSDDLAQFAQLAGIDVIIP